MSIGKRFVRLVRSNLNTLLEKSPHWEANQARIEDLSDEELQAELERRRTRREAAEQAANRAGSTTSREDNAGATRANAPRGVDEQAWREVEDAMRGEPRRTRTRQQRGYRQQNTAGARGNAGGGDRTAQLYAQLECPYGADINTVRKQYRALMRKYHPDLHSRDAEKQRLATDLSQRLTAAYNELRQLLSQRR